MKVSGERWLPDALGGQGLLLYYFYTFARYTSGTLMSDSAGNGNFTLFKKITYQMLMALYTYCSYSTFS